MLPVIEAPPQSVIIEAVRTFGSGGGGGGGSPFTITKYQVDYNAAGLATGIEVYSPTIADVILDWWLELDTAWNGLPSYFDLGTLTSGGKGLLLAAGLPTGIPLSTADAALTGNVGLFANPNSLSYSAALASYAIANGLPIPRHQLTVANPANPLKAMVSQDGSASAAVAASCQASAATAPPVTVTAGSNDTFILIGSPNGSATPETFTVAPGTYTSHGQIVTAMGAATGSVSGEAFSTKCTVSQSIAAVLTCTAVTAGAAANGNSLQPGPTDFLTPVAQFAVPGLFVNGVGGDPGASHGAAKLYILTATP